MDYILVMMTLAAISPADGSGPSFIGGHSAISLWQKKVERAQPSPPSFDFQKKLTEELAKVSLENSLEEFTAERARLEEEARNAAAKAKAEAEAAARRSQSQPVTYYAPVIRYGQPTYFVPSAVPTQYSSPSYSAPVYSAPSYAPVMSAPGGANCVGGS